MKSDGPAKAIAVCSKEAGPMAKIIGKEQGVRIGRTSLKLRNPANTPPDWASQLANKTATEPQFVKVDDNTIGALLPIKLQQKCLTCHGPVDSIATDVRSQLAALYPDDTATGFQEGDLRGWFWVEVPMNSQASTQATGNKLIQFGAMREVIGMQKHQGRVKLDEVTSEPNLFAVGAMEGLQGEVTIVNGVVTATQVNHDGKLDALTVTTESQATLLVGNRVTNWVTHEVEKPVAPDEYDAYLTELASNQGVDVSQPFVFTATGNFVDVRLHVIHGACPVHAERNGVELPPETRPFKGQFEKLPGTLVGVFARNAAGVLTHPGVSTHTHVVFAAPDGQQRTGHVESIGLAAGTILRLPAKRTNRADKK